MVDVAATGSGDVGLWEPHPGHERVEESYDVWWIQFPGSSHQVSPIFMCTFSCNLADAQS